MGLLCILIIALLAFYLPQTFAFKAYKPQANGVARARQVDCEALRLVRDCVLPGWLVNLLDRLWFKWRSLDSYSFEYKVKQ